MPTAPQYVLVAVTGPLRRSFTYRLPDGYPELQPGQRVRVPFGRGKRVGWVLKPVAAPPDVATKPVASIVDTEPLLPDLTVRLCLWMADYYFANPADCLNAALPPQLRGARTVVYIWEKDRPDYLPNSISRLARKGKRLSAAALKRISEAGPELLRRLLAKGIISEQATAGGPKPTAQLEGFRLVRVSAWSDLFQQAEAPAAFDGTRTAAELKALGVSDHYRRKAVTAGILEPVYGQSDRAILDFIEARPDIRTLKPTAEQAEAIERTAENLTAGFHPVLLHGITGSGKTLVYCHLVERVLEAGKSAMILTPEIALSANTLAYIRGYFGDTATVIHSGLSPAERLAAWQGIRDGRYRIVVGPRSALFAPISQPGLIVVDEEHDESYKQDEPTPRFHGRDSAIMLARLADIPIVLGSASPSVELYHHAVSGRYGLRQLRSRPAGSRLPEVTVLDMKEHRVGGDLPFVSLPLKQAVEGHLQRGKQVILYLNRRGYAPHLQCHACGHVPMCLNCRVRLTYHKTDNCLVCHYCGARRISGTLCGECKTGRMYFVGAGTQKVEEAVLRLFPSARPARFDSDTAAGRGQAWRILKDFAAGEQNLLLGTQMVTKGLDLPEVTLVGVLAADMGLHLPDFRASERTFARILQVAGRCGRAAEPGEVLIQTTDPEHAAVRLAARQDYQAFFTEAIADRQSAGYPPFTRLVNFILESAREQLLENQAAGFHDRLEKTIRSAKLSVTLSRPVECAFYRLRGRYRRQILAKVKPEHQQRLIRTLTNWELNESRFGLPAAVRVVIDVDPVDFM
jgi:primosomal protein N' (replication factor Y)